jgi:uncharacterized protein (DUF2141 family)
MKTTLLLILFCCGLTFYGHAETVQIIIKNIRNGEGNVSIGLYKSDDAFQNDRPFKQIQVPKSNLKNGTLIYTIDLPAGTYGIALLDDENKNEKMDTNFLGVPTEGYGFSEYVHSGMFRPSFSDFDFKVTKGNTKKVTVQMDYF